MTTSLSGLGNGRPRMFIEESVLLFRRVNSAIAVPYFRCNLGHVRRNSLCHWKRHIQLRHHYTRFDSH